jgi:hypothetical protein
LLCFGWHNCWPTAFLHQGGLGKSSQPKGFEKISIRKLAERSWISGAVAKE